MQVAAEKPREPTREEKQRIHARIGELYLDNGYTPPWTDKAVAEELKHPVAWVSKIRDEFYGPEGSNKLFEDFAARAQRFTDDFRSLRVELDCLKVLEQEAAEIDAMLKEIKRATKSTAR